jgi:hypothetical protein
MRAVSLVRVRQTLDEIQDVGADAQLPQMTVPMFTAKPDLVNVSGFKRARWEKRNVADSVGTDRTFNLTD